MPIATSLAGCCSVRVFARFVAFTYRRLYDLPAYRACSPFLFYHICPVHLPDGLPTYRAARLHCQALLQVWWLPCAATVLATATFFLPTYTCHAMPAAALIPTLNDVSPPPPHLPLPMLVFLLLFYHRLLLFYNIIVLLYLPPPACW